MALPPPAFGPHEAATGQAPVSMPDDRPAWMSCLDVLLDSLDSVSALTVTGEDRPEARTEPKAQTRR